MNERRLGWALEGAVANRAGGCAARTRALAIPAQPQGGPSPPPLHEEATGATRNPAPRLSLKLHVASTSPARGRTLTWSPGTRWAAAKSLGGIAAMAAGGKLQRRSLLPASIRRGPRLCCKALPAPAVQLERCRNRGGFETRQRKGPTPTHAPPRPRI